MTYQEANALVDDFSFVYKGKSISKEMLIECREVIHKALEKQIPKKPDLIGDGYDDNGNLVYDTWICPCCETQYELDYDDYKFCPECGQAIDCEVLKENE